VVYSNRVGNKSVESVAIFLPDLSGGGAERAALNLTRSFMQKGLEVTLLVQQLKGALLQDLPDGVYVRNLNRRRVLNCIFPIALYLRKEQPDILMSHLGHNNIVAIWAHMLARSCAKVMVVQHNSLIKECEANGGWRYRILPWLYRKFLPQADAIVAVSEGVADELATILFIPRSRIEVIYNPIVDA